jgi:hypothetical protein
MATVLMLPDMVPLPWAIWGDITSLPGRAADANRCRQLWQQVADIWST